MERLKTLLNIPAILAKPDIDGELKNLAEILMNEYCVSNGNHQYRPIEIEFYIYDKYKHADTHVYKRDGKGAGCLFYHYSGIDICFASSFQEGCFGGILIRALEREDGKCFGGPLVCLNEVLNTASAKCKIEQAKELKEYSSLPGQLRVGINDSDKKYRFIRSGVPETIEMSCSDYNFTTKKETIRKSKYKF